MHSLSTKWEEDSANNKTKRVKKNKNKGDADLPKRAMSAYILFGSEARVAIKEESPTMTSAEIMKELGARWKAMSAEDKIPYEEKAVIDKARFKKEMADYKEQKAAAGERSDSDAAPAMKKEKAPRARGKQDKNAPKGAMSAYIFFCAQARISIKEELPDISSKDLMKEMGVRWKALSAEDKAPYNEKAVADKARFKEEMAAYEERWT